MSLTPASSGICSINVFSTPSFSVILTAEIPSKLGPNCIESTLVIGLAAIGMVGHVSDPCQFGDLLD